MQRKFLILLILINLIGCDIIKTDDINESSDITTDMLFETSITNTAAPSDNVKISFIADGVSQQVSDVKLNLVSLSYDSTSQAYTSPNITLTKGDSYEVVCYLNQDNIWSETVSGNQIEILQLPSFKIKVANSLSGLASETAIDYTASISNDNVIGISIADTDGYSVQGTATVSNSTLGLSSATYEIKDGWFISSQLISGSGVGFTPDKIRLVATMTYNGQLNSSFKSGQVKRIISIVKEIEITN